MLSIPDCIIQSISNDIESVNTPDTARIEDILDRCNAVSVCDRRYIQNYSKLEDMLSECGIENTAAYTADELGVNLKYDNTVTDITSPITKTSNESLDVLNDNFSKLEESLPATPQKQIGQSQYVQTAFACVCCIIAVFVLAENRRKRNKK